jgi:hypothetical protein
MSYYIRVVFNSPIVPMFCFPEMVLAHYKTRKETKYLYEERNITLFSKAGDIIIFYYSVYLNGLLRVISNRNARS